jgi:hypothetical protein
VYPRGAEIIDVDLYLVFSHGILVKYTQIFNGAIGTGKFLTQWKSDGYG